MYSFGSGVLLGVRTDISNPTPINFGLIQSASIDISRNVKELYGQYQFPVAIGAGQGKIAGKATAAKISAFAFNNFFFGMNLATGQLATAYGESGSIPGTPYQITVANSANFVDDYGVIYAATGLPLTRVASSPTAGQYSVSAGVYTFAAADTGQQVLISYTYSISGTGQKFTYSNQLLGTAPIFQVQLFSTFQGKPFNLKLHSCVSSKLSLATKLEDFVMPDFEFSAQADAAGNILTFSAGEVS